MDTIVNVPIRNKKSKNILLGAAAVLLLSALFLFFFYIANDEPVADFSMSMEAVGTYNPVVFEASGSFDSDGDIVSYIWTFGDGAGAEGFSVSHEYAVGGFDPPVTLTVTDNRGKKNTIVKQIKVIKCVSCGE